MKMYKLLFLLIALSCKNYSETKILKSEVNFCKDKLIYQQAEIDTLKAQLFKIINKEISLSDLYTDVKQSVYLINTIDNDDTESQGSAFCVTKDGISISNYHVFENANEIYAYNNKGDKYLVTEIIEKNKDLDYIVFKLGPLSDSIPFLKVSNKKPLVGENVFTIGNPDGLKLTLSNGIISAYRKKYLLQTTTAITHGSSGGPLLNKKGEVVGITTSGRGEANLNFAVDINKLDLIKKLNTPYKNKIIPKRTEKEILAILNEYYINLQSENFAMLSNSYADNLTRFHRLYNVSKSESINNIKKFFFPKYKILKVEVLPESLKVYSNRGEYTIQYKLDFLRKNKKTNEIKTFILESVVILNTEGKIKSIYENILVQNKKPNFN